MRFVWGKLTISDPHLEESVMRTIFAFTTHPDLDGVFR